MGLLVKLVSVIPPPPRLIPHPTPQSRETRHFETNSSQKNLENGIVNLRVSDHLFGRNYYPNVLIAIRVKKMPTFPPISEKKQLQKIDRHSNKIQGVF